MGIARQRRRMQPCTGRGDHVEWALEPADTAAVHRLRHQIMAALARIADPGADLSATEVVVAELLSNALAHATGQAWISLRWDGDHPLLSVADLGPGFATLGPETEPDDETGEDPDESNEGLVDAARTLLPRLPDDPLAEGGRGLYLVAALALDVAVAARATGGTVVSVTLDLKRAS